MWFTHTGGFRMGSPRQLHAGFQVCHSLLRRTEAISDCSRAALVRGHSRDMYSVALHELPVCPHGWRARPCR